MSNRLDYDDRMVILSSFPSRPAFYPSCECHGLISRSFGKRKVLYCISLAIIYANWDFFASEWIVTGCVDAQRGWRVHGNHASQGHPMVFRTQRGRAARERRIWMSKFGICMFGDTDREYNMSFIPIIVSPACIKAHRLDNVLWPPSFLLPPPSPGSCGYFHFLGTFLWNFVPARHCHTLRTR